MDDKTKKMTGLIRKKISGIDPTAQVILYGSRSRGDARNDSDWDILILTDYPVNLVMETEFRNHLYELEIQTGEPLSVFVYSKQEWFTTQHITPFFENVTNEGIQL